MGKPRYHRNTIGLNAEALVAAATAYTANATYKAFVQADTVEGEIGIFNADTGALITAAMSAGTRFFFAQKKDGGTFKTSAAIYSAADVKRVAYTAPVKQVATVTFSSSYSPALNDEIAISVIETTPGNQPFPRWTWIVQAKSGESRSQLIARVAAAINDVTDAGNGEKGLIVSASVAGEVITLTSLFDGASFRVALQEKAFEVATSAITVAFKQGSGYYDHVKDIELAGNIFAGNTTQYPNQNATDEEFGAPTKFASSALTYNVYQISSVRRASSPFPIGENVHKHNTLVAVPVPVGADDPAKAASSPDLAVKTVLGF